MTATSAGVPQSCHLVAPRGSSGLGSAEQKAELGANQELSLAGIVLPDHSEEVLGHHRHAGTAELQPSQRPVSCSSHPSGSRPASTSPRVQSLCLLSSCSGPGPMQAPDTTDIEGRATCARVCRSKVIPEATMGCHAAQRAGLGDIRTRVQTCPQMPARECRTIHLTTLCLGFPIVKWR